MRDSVIFYPHGGGGSWLKNLIYNLTTEKSIIEDVDLVFDYTPHTKLVEVRHKFDYTSLGFLEFADTTKYKKIFLFSNNKPFNLFLNENKKIHYNPKIYNNQILSFPVQLELISQRAHHLITDENFKKHYFSDIALDSSLIFTDPESFTNDLFKILDELKISYRKDCNFCLKSIDNYKKTCDNPINHIGNLDSILWAGWCHGLIMADLIKVPCEFNFVDAQNINEVKEFLLSINQSCIELTKNYCFFWK